MLAGPASQDLQYAPQALICMLSPVCFHSKPVPLRSLDVFLASMLDAVPAPMHFCHQLDCMCNAEVLHEIGSVLKTGVARSLGSHMLSRSAVGRHVTSLIHAGCRRPHSVHQHAISCTGVAAQVVAACIQRLGGWAEMQGCSAAGPL